MRVSVWLLACGLLAGCSAAVQDANVSSGFETPGSLGFGSIFSTDFRGAEFSPLGGGYAYTLRAADGGGIEAVAGLLPGTDTRFWPGTGSATYRGTYELGVIPDINLNGDQIGGFTERATGDIRLTADFAGNTLNGRSTDGDLIIRGDMDGRVMSGSVTYLGVSGDLQGRAGIDEAIGVFHGENGETMYAGGFIATP